MTFLTPGEIEATGGVVPAEPVKKTIHYTGRDPDTGELRDLSGEIWVKRISVKEYELIARASRIDPEDPEGENEEGRTAMAQTIAACVLLGAKGNQTISYETALTYNPSIASAMVIAVQEVNNPEKKTSTPTTSSGAPSSQPESAGEPSRKQNKTSRSPS